MNVLVIICIKITSYFWKNQRNLQERKYFTDGLKSSGAYRW